MNEINEMWKKKKEGNYQKKERKWNLAEKEWSNRENK